MTPGILGDTILCYPGMSGVFAIDFNELAHTGAAFSDTIRLHEAFTGRHPMSLSANELKTMPKPINWLNTRQAAHHLGMKPDTLEKWRMKGLGPRYVKMGSRVRYDYAEIVAYIDSGKMGTDW